MSHLVSNNRRILSIIIPAYNEQETIGPLLEKVMQIQLLENIDKEILVINDGSDDNTFQEAKKIKNKYPEEKIVLQSMPCNSGKGACVRKGLDLFTGEYVIIQDADLEYDPSDYNVLLEPVINGFADVVYGSRFKGEAPHRMLLFWHYMGNILLTMISNMLTNLNLSDMETGYKLFRADAIKQVSLKENRFGFEPEVTAKISRLKDIRIYEVGISYYGRTYNEGKKIRWTDGVYALYCILKYNFSSGKGKTGKPELKQY